MGIAQPTGQYAGQMLSPGGWPESDEDMFYDRAQQYNQMLRKVTDAHDAARRQQVEIFDGGVWSGGAANAANGALGTNLTELSTLQDYLVTVVTWHRHIGDLIVRAKADIGNNVDGAQREIIVLENDQELEPEARTDAINALVRETHQANSSLVAEAAEQVLASKNWKPPHNALEDLLRQVTPPAPDVPALVVPAPNTPTPGVPTPTPFEPTPANPYQPIGPGAPISPITPTPFEPTPANPYDPSGPGVPETPITPVPPVIPVNPNRPVTPIQPVTPGRPVTPVAPVNPGPAPSPAPTPVNPSPVTPPPSTTPVGPSPDQPSTPVDPATPMTPATPGTEPAHVKPAAATDVAPGHAGQAAAPSHRSDDTSPAMTPAAAGAMPGPAARGSSAGVGSTMSAGAGQSTGAAAASGAGSRAAGGRAPLGAAGKAPATAATRAASARTAPPARPQDAEKDKKKPADEVTALPSVPVSAARAARDAVAAASGAGGAKRDPLRLARRVAAALNARDSGSDDHFGFFWITAVTTDGDIVVANSYGLAYLPDGVQLPAKVFLASADRAVPPGERARCATYPVLAVQSWAAYHDLKLRAVIGTAEQLANSDPGVPKIILEVDDIPDSGKMVGRSRLEVVDPAATAQLTETDDLHLLDLLPPAPAAENAPDDERHMLWFELMKPMTSTAAGREVAHLRAFGAYAKHCQELALHQAYGAADATVQRPAIEEFMYWRYLRGLLDSALATGS